MPVRSLKASRALSTEHFSQPDAYEAHNVLGGGISTPLNPRDFSAHRAILSVQSGLFVLQRSFARHLEADLGTDHGVGLIVPITYRCTINGNTIDDSVVGLMRGKTPAKVIEEHPNTYFMLRFNSDMRHRGWPDGSPTLQYVHLQNDRMRRLRAVLQEMFSVASACRDLRQFEGRNCPIQETFMAALDDAMVANAALRVRPGSYGRYLKLIDRLDELVDQFGSAPLYIDDLALALCVSVRTLHTATQLVHGMSVYRYLRLKRLWSVRKLLTSGSPGLTVKAAAVANGFWHMGEFSNAYQSVFGELPSGTLALARRA